MKELIFIVPDDGTEGWVEIDAHKTVQHLKVLVQRALRWPCAAEDLALYVARHRHSNQWVTMDEVRSIRRGDVPVAVQVIVEDASAAMDDPDACVGDSAFGFPDAEDRGEYDTHVLVVLPESARHVLRMRRYSESAAALRDESHDNGSWLDALLQLTPLASAWRSRTDPISSAAATAKKET